MKKLNSLKNETLIDGQDQNIDIKNKIINNKSVVDFKREAGKMSLLMNEASEFNINKRKKMHENINKNRIGTSLREYKAFTKLKYKNILNENMPIHYLYKVFRKSLLLDEDFISKNIKKIKKNFFNNIQMLQEMGVFELNEDNELFKYILVKLNEKAEEEVEKLDDNMKSTVDETDVLHEMDDSEKKVDGAVNSVMKKDSQVQDITDNVSDNIKDNVARAIKDEQDRINKINNDNEELEEVLTDNDEIVEDEGEDIEEVKDEVEEENGNEDLDTDMDNEDEGSSEEEIDDSEEKSSDENKKSEDNDDSSKEEEEKIASSEDVKFLARRTKDKLKYSNTGSLFNNIQNGIIKNALKIINESKSTKELNMDLVLAESIMFYTLLETLNIFDLSNLKTKNDIVRFCKIASEGFVF